MATMQKISTNLWFNTQAEEAAHFYTSIFKDSRIGRIAKYSGEGQEIHHMPPGSVMTIEFWLGDNAFVGLNGGPIFKFNEAVSLIVNCGNQDEVDYYWEKLSEGGDPKSQVCGWLKDKYGLSWQITSAEMEKVLREGSQEQVDRITKAFLKMKKPDIAQLQAAIR